MPEPLPPSDDEIVSAYLDGEATDDEIARVEASPALRAEVDALRAVADMVATEPDPALIDQAQREAHISAALDASTTAPNVTSLAATRSRPWYRHPVTAVAAVLLAVVIAVPLLANVGDGSDDNVATSAEEATDEATADESAASSAARDAEADEGFLAEEAGDATDGGSGDESTSDDGAAAAPAEMELDDGDLTAFYARIRPSLASGSSFASAEAVAEAYDELRELEAQGGESAATTTAPADMNDAESGGVLPCVELFTADVLVATIDDVGEVLVGTIDGETVIIALDDNCDDQLFPDE